MKQPNVLILSNRGDFSHTLMSRWHSERLAPAFTVMSGEVFNPQVQPACDLIIVGGIESSRLNGALAALSHASQPVIVVASEPAHAAHLPARSSKVLVLRQHEGWLDLLIVLATEVMKRVEMTDRAQRAEELAAESQSQATLGRYMLDMRHSLNNALTSVLGNAELLLLEPEQFTDAVRDQLTTIRAMSLRMNEIISRFSSLEAELSLARRESKGEVIPFVRANVAGWSSF